MTTPPPPRRRDYGFIAIATFIAVNALWILLMPWVPSIASATLHRFHLRSSSFAVWAVQFPIPAMYNFSNRYEVSELPPGLVDPIIEVDRRRHINHFPFRSVTFSDARYRNLRDGKDRWITFDSSYRGQSIETSVHAKPTGHGGFVIVRLPARSDQ